MQQKKDGMFFNAFEGLESVDPNAPPRRGHLRNKKKAKPLSDIERQQNFLEGLVIVGYESNLFRNDRLSESIERGEHFIPWMGKEDLMIDRYDARALLTDLKLFDRQAGRWDALPRTRKPSDPKYERELKLNKKLDKERYWDMVLHGEDIYKEEERKRQKMQQDTRATYSLVGLDYGEITKHEDEEEKQKREEDARKKELEEAEAKRKREEEETKKREEEEKYCAPHPVPEGMIAPALKKMGVIIEKTAGFLFRQGPEAVNTLKKQQKDNPMFLFLVEGHPLNPYLKFLIGKLEEAKKREEEEKEKANEFALSLVAEYNDEEEPFKAEESTDKADTAEAVADAKSATADEKQAEPSLEQKHSYIAMFDFTPEKDGEMSMKVGEVLVGRETVDGWLEVERDGQVGYVPRGWVKLVDEQPPCPASSQGTGASVAQDKSEGEDEQAKAAVAAAKRKRMMRAKLLAQLITTGKEHVVQELCSSNIAATDTPTGKEEKQDKADESKRKAQEEREREERRMRREAEREAEKREDERRRRKRRRSRSRSRSRSPRGERDGRRRRERSGSRESKSSGGKRRRRSESRGRQRRGEGGRRHRDSSSSSSSRSPHRGQSESESEEERKLREEKGRKRGRESEQRDHDVEPKEQRARDRTAGQQQHEKKPHQAIARGEAEEEGGLTLLQSYGAQQ